MNISEIAAVVAGGASGLGAATARRLVALGARCVVLDRDEHALQMLAAELGENAIPVVGDIMNDEDVLKALRAGGDRPMRLAVICAFVGSMSPVISREGVASDIADFRRVVDINLIGSFNVLRLAAQEIAKLAPLADGERGLIIQTSSIAGLDGPAPQIAYNASKGGVAAMTLSASRDLAPHAIRVMTIAPGMFGTPVVMALPAEYRDSIAKLAVFPKRVGLPDEYARLVVSFAECAYLNGEVVRLDGGMRLNYGG
ncbi:SDR family NAD(P)-dependent oxidoreductase [Pseudomonas sp. GB2N2]